MNADYLALLCPFGLLIVGVLGAGVLACFAYRAGGKKVKPARVIRSKIAEIRDGEVCRVKGRLVAREEPLKSPLTNKPCIYFRFKVEQAYEIKTWTTRYSTMSVLTTGDGSESTSERETWHTIIDDVQRVPVAVEDETGRAYLDLADARFDGVAVKKEGVIHTCQESGLGFDLMLQKRYGESTLAPRRSGVSSAYSRRASFQRQGRELPKATVREEAVEDGVEVYVVGEVEVRDGKPPRFRPVDHPLIIARKSRDAELPEPGNPAVGLWVAAGLVLGLSLLISLGATIAVCSGLVRPSVPNVTVPRQLRPPG